MKAKVKRQQGLSVLAVRLIDDDSPDDLSPVLLIHALGLAHHHSQRMIWIKLTLD